MKKPVATHMPTPIRALFAKMQFKMQESINNERFLLVKGTMPAYDFRVLFKAAPLHRVRDTIRQRNHVLWTRTMQTTIPANAPFHIAPILEDGSIKGTWYWFITPFVEGQLLADTDRPAEIMPHIVALMRHIEKTNAQTVAGLDARHGSLARKDKLQLLETTIHWARNDTPFLAELLQIISSNYRYLGTTNAHGDFTETNIIVNAQRQPVLIDAEISDAYGYKYYDAAEFYNRLATRAIRPDLAQAFLREYLAVLPRQSRQHFLNNFLCLSAMRAVGDWMEATSVDGLPERKHLTAIKQYAESIVTYRIITPA